MWSTRDKTPIRKTFRTLSEAKTWRQDAAVALRQGTMRAPSKMTLRQAWDAWLKGARAGSVRTRSGDCFKPSAARESVQDWDRQIDELNARTGVLSR